MFFFKRKRQPIDPELLQARIAQKRAEHDAAVERRHDQAFNEVMRRIETGAFEINGDYIGVYTKQLEKTDEAALRERLQDTLFEFGALRVSNYSETYVLWLYLKSTKNPLYGDGHE